MRLALLVPVLFSVALPAYAQSARESRYGPTTPRQAYVAAAARYDGPMLGWANKRQTSTAPTPAAPSTPAVYAPPVAAAPALPTSLYAPPVAPAPAASTPVNYAPAPVPAPAAAKDWSTYRSARVAAAAPAAPSPTALPPGATGARFYSVDRPYGLTPDAAPKAAPDNRVLIAATEPPPEPKDATPVHGSADWLAAGVAGDDDQDDSASRRAKTRNEAL